MYATKQSEIDLKYQNKFETIKNIHNQEIIKLYEDFKKNKEKYTNKQILLLQNKLKAVLKLNKYDEAEEIMEELKKEKERLINEKNQKNKKNLLLKEKNLKIKHGKKINEIILMYNKEKNDIQKKFNKEKEETELKFKNQLKDFEMFKNKQSQKIIKDSVNKNIKTIKNKKCSDYSKNQQFNKSFDIDKLNEKTSSDSEL